ncbi:hypothetical protein ACRQ5Q_14800 [Bradyrhizobium sp. PMVTL-01]|uniref:hypothetical protein n=1 Tax=Bradyrhizobium sp. PMVTL-01 TaxID=3434999 RepID=UPI003F72F431
MLTQHQFEKAHRKIADLNDAFMELVNHPTNPMTKRDLAALIKRDPDRYGRFEGFLDKLPWACDGHDHHATTVCDNVGCRNSGTCALALADYVDRRRR